MNIVNLTPHVITILREGQDPLVIASSGIASAQQETREIDALSGTGIRVTATVYGVPVGLPAEEEGTALVVSFLAAQAVQQAGLSRGDIFIPGPCPHGHKGCPECRDDQGRVKASHGLAVL